MDILPGEGNAHAPLEELLYHHMSNHSCQLEGSACKPAVAGRPIRLQTLSITATGHSLVHRLTLEGV
jgi:hypothetical protein